MEFFDIQLIAGGSTVALVLGALKLLYSALREERDRVTILGDKYSVEMERKDAAHAREREEWRKEKEYLKQEILNLRSQVADLYNRLYKFEINDE